MGQRNNDAESHFVFGRIIFGPKNLKILGQHLDKYGQWSTNHMVNGSLKIELCETEIENSSSDVLILEYQRIQDQVIIQQNANFTQVLSRQTSERPVSEYL